MIQIPDIREAGSKVYVGFAMNTGGDTMMKVYGPVTICESHAEIGRAHV